MKGFETARPNVDKSFYKIAHEHTIPNGMKKFRDDFE